MRSLVSLAAAGALLLGGCASMAPPYERPAAPVATAARGLGLEWWAGCSWSESDRRLLEASSWALLAAAVLMVGLTDTPTMRRDWICGDAAVM